MDENQNQAIQTNKSNKIIIWVVLTLIVVVGGYFLLKGNFSQPVSTEPIKIGVSGPLTGELASWGVNLSAGVELARNEINNAGGINGQMIELVIENDKCEPTTAVNAFNKLINIDKVVSIIGPICSSAGGSALPVAQQNNVPVIIVSASAPHLTKIGDHIFRIYPSDAFQGKVGAEFMFNILNKKKVAVIYVNNDWGVGIKDVFINDFKNLGGEVVSEDSVLQDAKDIRTQLTKAKNSSAEALYFPAYPANAIGGLKQAKELGLKIPIVGGDAFDGEEVVKSPSSEGLIYTVPKILDTEDFKAKNQSIAGQE